MEKPNSDINTIQYPNTKKVEDPKLKSSTPLKSGESSIQYGCIDDDVPLLLAGDHKRSWCYTRFQHLKTLTIEPLVLFYLFAFLLNVSCLTNMMMDKGCLYHLNYTDEICKNLSGHPVEKEEVEILANNYGLYSNLMSLFGAFQMVFIAPWSDKYGRKLPLILSTIGSIISDLGLVMCTIRFDSPLYYIILAKAASDIFGGFICVLTIVYSHASEVSSEKTRTLKFTTIEIALGLGMALGGLAGGLIYKYFGYIYIYLTSTVVHLLCVPWIILCVQETTGLDSKVTWSGKMRDFFVYDSLMKGCKAAVRRRENKDRAFLLLFFASMCIIILTYESFGTIGFTFVHHLYNWDQGKYSIVNTIFTFTQFLILGISLPLLVRKFKVSDNALGFVGVVSMMGKFAVIAFAKYSILLYYLGNVVGYMSAFASLSIRSGISRIADKDEIGRVFSFLATCEAVIPMVGTIVITKVFNDTMDIYPSVSYLMTVVFLFLPLGTFAWAHRSFTKGQRLQDNSSKISSLS